MHLLGFSPEDTQGKRDCSLLRLNPGKQPALLAASCSKGLESNSQVGTRETIAEDTGIPLLPDTFIHVKSPVIFYSCLKSSDFFWNSLCPSHDR